MFVKLTNRSILYKPYDKPTCILFLKIVIVAEFVIPYRRIYSRYTVCVERENALCMYTTSGTGWVFQTCFGDPSLMDF